MIVPYNDGQGQKKQQVARMFDNIARRYDFLNHFLSLGIDRYWRQRAIGLLKPMPPDTILDIATGTGDFAMAAARAFSQCRITGVDISMKMLDIGRKKLVKRGLSDRITLLSGDSEALQFDNDQFDVAIVAFGVRNFEDPLKGLNEILRVLKKNGRLVILEFSRPDRQPFRWLYMFYFLRLLPFIGRIVSKDSRAYSYLPASVLAFPEKEGMAALLSEAGFASCTYRRLTFGIATAYLALK